jgi:hypothetical protein
VVRGVDDRSLPAVTNTAANSLIRSGRLILLVAMISAAGGLVGGLLREGQGAVYEAEALVAASQTSLPADNFTDLGSALFRTDTVLQPVVEELNLRISPQTLLSKDYLSVESVSSAVAVQVIAHDSDPQTAAALANTAAQSFSSALTDNEMGTFAVFEDNDVAKTSGLSPIQSTLLAAALGAVLGAAILLLRTLVVRPVLSQDEALGVFPADIAFSASVRSAGFSFLRKGTSRFEVLPHGLLPAIGRSTGDGQEANSLDACYVLVERNRRGDRAARAVLHELGASRGESPEDLNWVAVSDRRLGHAIEEAGVVVALVSQGVSRRSLQLLTEELFVASGRRLLIMVFVGSTRRGGSTVSAAWSGPRQLFARWWSSMRSQFSGSRPGGT